jgi:hypothetical protein
MSTPGPASKPRTDGAIQWLLDGDPAIRWQALRDLVGAAERIVERERRKVARDGWAARLLARRGPEGTWAAGLHYDILRALDHFQAVDAPRDRRLAEAIAIVRGSRREDGRWSLEHSYKGKTFFELERLGAPSRWNTLRALRVLKWWDRGA